MQEKFPDDYDIKKISEEKRKERQSHRCLVCEKPVGKSRFSVMDCCSEACYDTRQDQIKEAMSKKRPPCRNCGKKRLENAVDIYCSFSCKWEAERKKKNAKPGKEDDSIKKSNEKWAKTEIDEESVRKRNRRLVRQMEWSQTRKRFCGEWGFGRTVRG